MNDHDMFMLSRFHHVIRCMVFRWGGGGGGGVGRLDGSGGGRVCLTVY